MRLFVCVFVGAGMSPPEVNVVGDASCTKPPR